MKYKYMPNCSIIDYENLKVKFKFDANGEYETNDPKLITWIKKNKNFLKPVQEPQKPELETKVPEKKEFVDKKLYKCKKCDFTTENVGELLAHYRQKHPKE